MRRGFFVLRLPRLPADPLRRRALARVGLAALALVALVAALALTVGIPTPAQLAAWARSAGPAAPLLFVLFAAVSTCVLFPGNVTATAAGVVFGVFGGVALTARRRDAGRHRSPSCSPAAPAPRRSAGCSARARRTGGPGSPSAASARS